MNSVYLYLHRIMISCTPQQNKIVTKNKKVVSSNERIIDRKRALGIIGRYLKFIPKLKKDILDDMVELKLLEKLNRDKYGIINEDKSKTIDSELLLKIVESGMGKKNNAFPLIVLLFCIKYMWESWFV